MSTKPRDSTDIISGVLLMAISLFFGLQTLSLELGTSINMGPGYFPMFLSAILFVLGLIVFIKAFGREGEPFGKISWRGMLFILPAPILFGLTVRGLGFVPSLFLTALVAAQASTKMRLVPALVLAALVTIVSTIVFSYALGLPFVRFGPWLRF